MNTKHTGNLTIGKLAKEAGVGIETVRFYEKKGLLKRPLKTLSGFRKYSSDDAKRIRFIKRAQELGFTLREIKDILELNARPRSTCSDVKLKADEKIKEIEEKIKDLHRMKKSLNEISDACGDGKQALSECRVLDCFESGWKC